MDNYHKLVQTLLRNLKSLSNYLELYHCKKLSVKAVFCNENDIALYDKVYKIDGTELRKALPGIIHSIEDADAASYDELIHNYGMFDGMRLDCIIIYEDEDRIGPKKRYIYGSKPWIGNKKYYETLTEEYGF